MTYLSVPKRETTHSNLVSAAARRLLYAVESVRDNSAIIAEVGELIGEALKSGRKILVFGNGGSAACAQHFSAEFTGKLKLDRRPLPSISLTTDTSALTAIANDYGYDQVFSRQVTALAEPGDIVLGLSTSGRSVNVHTAFNAAREVGAVTIALTGSYDALGAEHSIKVPLQETARVQEAHDLILHELAQIAERIAAPEVGPDSSACPFPFELAVERIEEFRSWVEETGQTLTTTNGCFDLFHRGHEHSLRAARKLGDRLVVMVNDDDSVRRLKGQSRPIREIDARVRDLSRISAVDHVVIMAEDDPRVLLSMLRPDVHAKGADYLDRDLLEREIVESAGGRIAFLDLVDGVSTSAEIDRINE